MQNMPITSFDMLLGSISLPSGPSFEHLDQEESKEQPQLLLGDATKVEPHKKENDVPLICKICFEEFDGVEDVVPLQMCEHVFHSECMA